MARGHLHAGEEQADDGAFDQDLIKIIQALLGWRAMVSMRISRGMMSPIVGWLCVPPRRGKVTDAGTAQARKAQRFPGRGLAARKQ